MAIGQHVAKAMAAKQIDEQKEDEAPSVSAAATDTVTKSDLLSAMKLLIEEMRSVNLPAEGKERLALEAERLLLEQERIKREMPENKQAPGISVFSYPEGELANPKPKLKCKFFWCGPEEKHEVLTPEEIILRNRLEPGDYMVTKADSTKIPFKVTAERRNDGGIEKMIVWYPCKDDHRHNHLSNVSYLKQVLGEHIPSTDELMAQLASLRAELAMAQAGKDGTAEQLARR